MDPELVAEAAALEERLVGEGATRDVAGARAREWLSRRQKAAQFASEAEAARSEIRGPGMGRGLSASAAQGATFGFSDEISGAMGAIGAMVPGGRSPAEAYRQDVAREREALGQFREDHPVAATAAEVGGGLVTGVLTGGAAAGAGNAGRLSTVGRLAGVGAAEGAVAGIGMADGGLEDRVRGGVEGAAMGAAGGVLLPAAGRVLGGVGRRALDATNLRPSKAGTTVGRLVDSVEERAATRFRDALPEDPTRIAEIESTLRETTRPLTAMDVDRNVAGVARAARGVEGPAKNGLPNYLAGRVSGQEERVLNDVFRLTSTDPAASLMDTVDDIVTRRSQNAAEQYGAIRDVPVPVERVRDFMSRPSFQDAYRRAARTAADDNKPIPSLEAVLESETVPLGVLDEVKKGLDGLLETGRGRKLDANSERVITQAKNQFLEVLDQVVPEYADARSAFAGESALLDAANQGRRLFRMRPEEAQRVLRDMGDSEREMFVRGGIEALQDKIEGVAGSHDLTAKRPLSDRTTDKKRLRLLFPDDESFTAFQRSLAEEAQIAGTNRFVTGGSNTAEKLMEMAELAGVSLPALASGNVPSILAGLANSALRRRSQGFTNDLGEELMPMLTATGPDAADLVGRATRMRQEVGAQLARRDARIAGAAGVGAAVLGTGRRDRDRSRDR